MNSRKEPNVIQTGNFVDETADWIAGRIISGQKNGGIFRMSLCGGSTPRPIYEALAERSDIDWERVLLTFGDERNVPPDHEDSNYRMVKEALLDPAMISRNSVVRIAGEFPAAEAAERCEGQLRKLAMLAGEEVFRHDLILLGMGEDGHTASLFPETSALSETERWVVANRVPKFECDRITFTYPLINAAGTVAFLISGEMKLGLMNSILFEGADLPAGRVDVEDLLWFAGQPPSNGCAESSRT